MACEKYRDAAPDAQGWSQESQGADRTEHVEGCEKQQGILYRHWVEETGKGECTPSGK